MLITPQNKKIYFKIASNSKRWFYDHSWNILSREHNIKFLVSLSLKGFFSTVTVWFMDFCLKSLIVRPRDRPLFGNWISLLFKFWSCVWCLASRGSGMQFPVTNGFSLMLNIVSNRCGVAYCYILIVIIIIDNSLIDPQTNSNSFQFAYESHNEFHYFRR